MKLEVTYERNIHKSYMKVPSTEGLCLDEKLIFDRNLEGVIPCEKCQINGKGQYWYDISGKQALDSYCKMNTIGQTLFERLILQLCSQLEMLEWNLIAGSCLVLKPEYIFLNHNAEEISFVLYPNAEGDFFLELRGLMEYLLTKLNHEEKEAVHAAYDIYEITLVDGFSITELKNRILQRRMEEISMECNELEQESGDGPERIEQEIPSDSSWIKQIKNAIDDVFKKIKSVFEKEVRIEKRGKRNLKEEIPAVIYPEEEEAVERIDIHPTVCLASTLGEPRGVLLYEGTGDFPDFEIGHFMCVIGKSHRVNLQIEKETISKIHAKIEYLDGIYYIEDMNSTNGTFVNDKILSYKERKGLNSGEVIRFADVKYRFL